MRKVIFAINMTLDGNCDHAKGVPSDELYPYYTNLMREAGVLAYGRKTYELMVPYWPDIASIRRSRTNSCFLSEPGKSRKTKHEDRTCESSSRNTSPEKRRRQRHFARWRGYSLATDRA